MENAVGSASLGVLILMVVVDRHIGIEGDLEVNYIGLVDIILIDLFGDNVESDIVVFF